MYTLLVKRPAYSHHNRTQVFCSWKPGSANTFIGQRIGRFQFTEEIEKDAHNSVFRGLDIDNNNPVVIKLFSPEVSQNDDYARAFKRGILDAETIEDGSFAPIYDAGMTIRNQLYLVMAAVPNQSLQNWIFADGLPTKTTSNFAEALAQQKTIAETKEVTNAVFALRFAEQIATHLLPLEKEGIVHQNLSPSKILITPNDDLMIIGLGIPQRASANAFPQKLTFYPLPYHPPEGTLSIQGHMFTLGVMLYEMLAGTRPFLQEKRKKYATNSSSSIIPLPDVCSGLSDATYALVAQCLQKSVWNRYETITDLQVTIAHALAQETAVAQPFLNKETGVETPIVIAPDVAPKETAVPITPKPKPIIKPVKQIKKPAKQAVPLQPMAETIAKAAVLPKPNPISGPVASEVSDELTRTVLAEEVLKTEKKRSRRILILPLVGLLFLLLAGGAFMMSQPESTIQEDDMIPVVAAVAIEDGANVNVVKAIDVTETAVAAVLLATPTPPTLQIISPTDDSEFALTDTLLFQIRWPFTLADGEELFIQVQDNTWGDGTIIGTASAQNEESDVYEFSVPIKDISKLEGTYWWQILLDGDGSGPNVGLPLSELRPFTIFTPTITPTRVTVTSAPTEETTPTPQKIACVRNANWVSYTIQTGDALSKLAQNRGVAIAQILEANCLSEIPILTINSRILLPKPIATATKVPSNTPTVTPSPIPTAPPPSNPSNPPTSIPATATVPAINPTSTTPPLPTAVNTAVPPTATIPSIPTETPVPPTAVPPTTVPPTTVPPTAVPPTEIPATAVPPTTTP